MKSIRIVFLEGLMIISILAACRKDDNIEKKKPGCFILTELGNVENSALKSAAVNADELFDFGDLKASKEYFFLLLNGGDEPVFNISLSTDDSSFAISPSHINEIAGGSLISNINNTGLVRIITLGITHGTYLNGTGYASLLPMGINTSALTITGKTIDNGDTIDITSEYDITVNANIMDIELYRNGNKIDITKPAEGKLATEIDGMDLVRYHSIGESGILSIKNTGNVPIDLWYGEVLLHDKMVKINPSDSLILDLPDLFNLLILDGKGTVTDYRRIQRGIDGKGYIGITRL